MSTQFIQKQWPKRIYIKTQIVQYTDIYVNESEYCSYPIWKMNPNVNHIPK